MSEYEPPQPGWWKASDGNWYPPESHPDRQKAPQPPPMRSPQPRPPTARPTYAAPPGPPTYAAPSANPQRPRPQAWLLGGIAALAAVGVFFAVASSSSDDGRQVEQVTDTVSDASTDTQETSPDSEAAEEAPADPPPQAVAETTSGPLAFDALVPVVFDSFGDADGSVWNVRVSPPRDVTDAVLASNQFNDPPPDGIVFAGFDVEMTLASAGKEPLSPGFNFSWEILGGSTNAVYDSSTVDGLFGCGVLAAEFDDYAEVFVGGTLTGIVCIPIPSADLRDPSSQVAMNFGGDRVIFSADGARPEPVEVAGADGSTSGGTERALGVLVPVEFDTFGDADGSVWNVVVSPLRDMTNEVRDANQFNDEAPAGVVFAGFDLEMTLASAGKVPLSTGFNVTWEVLGGATSSVYNPNTIADIFGCGVTSNDFSEQAEVFVGGTLDGSVCIPIPTDDFAHADTRIAFNIDGARILFLPDGPTPDPAPIDSGGGPEIISDTRPTGVATEVEWDSLGDADGSVWTTTVYDLRDITAEVLAENPFNDAPPEGYVWLGFDAEMTLDESNKEPLSAGFNFQWEVLGGETRRVYTPATFTNLLGCGVVDNQFDQYGEVFNGGTLSGTVCIPVPIADLGHPDTQISMKFDDTRITFRPT